MYYSYLIVLSIAYSVICIPFDTVKAECNGGASLCDRSYADISQLVTHDSYALTPNLAGTQDYDIIDQLNDGIRGIKLSPVPFTNDPLIINLCHTHCLILDAGLASETLNNINAWLEANPKEVVTIMWNNLYDLQATQVAAVYNSSNLMPHVYTHNQSEPWPTLQTMIDSGKRLVNFIDAGADTEHVPWLMDQFSRVFETPYDNTNINAFNCNVDRIGKDKDPKDLMYVMNHFLYGVIELGPLKVETPQRDRANETNSASVLLPHINNCTKVFQKKPNFIEVDFYQIGDALAIISSMNNVTFKPLRPKKNLMSASNSSTTTAIRRNSLSPTEHVLIDNSGGAENMSTQTESNVALSILIAFVIFTTFNYY